MDLSELSLVMLVLLAAGAVVGVIEWVKKLIPKAPSLVWHAALLPLCLGIGMLLPTDLGMRLLLAGVLLLLTQVGYQLIIQGVLKWFKGIARKAAVG